MNSDNLRRLKSLAKHFLIVAGLTAAIILIFFYMYLPMTTNHGETITVPDIQNQPYSELENILGTRSLRYEVNPDSGYSASQEPLTVLDQFPKSNARVKENRKIYVTLNAKRPPMVKMPDLIDKSLKIAQISLESFDLKLGEVEYVPDNALNAVIRQERKGMDIPAGAMIEKGTIIDLKVGDGNGNRQWNMYDYTNKSFEEVRIALIGSGLQIGNVTYVDSPYVVMESMSEEPDTVDAIIEVPTGYVVNHDPSVGRTVRLQDLVDLWVYHRDSIPTGSSLLENPE